MSLPPGFLDELKTRLPITQVVGRKVVWDQRKSKPHQGDMWGPCPFHQEKSASFHAVDRDGFYKCFGCQASGDVIKFVQETENASFMEAIEILATEAGMQMPSPDPKAREKADLRTQLFEVTEAAVQFFRRSLDTGAGAASRAYLDKRGVKPKTRETFEIGYAPGGFQALFDAMTAKGIKPELLMQAGLAKASQKGGKPYDVFRDRIVFPIRDAQKRCIGFGGRAMDANDPAKYLNSPETPLFDKSRAVYNLGPARAASGKGGQIILAEGYMDVIALVEAGFETACAPMGTAITDAQLEMIWAASPEPVLMMDGDTAGQNAAHRAIARALPLLKPGRSLRFAGLPMGTDPDDLIRAKGTEAMRAVIDAARPMIALMWERAIEGRNFDSPERRATLDADLRKQLAQIGDPSIRNHYGAAIKDKRAELFGFGARQSGGGAGMRARPPGSFKDGRWQPAPLPSAELRASALAHESPDGPNMLEAVILGVLGSFPALIPDYLDLLERLEPQDHVHETLRLALLMTPEGAQGEAFQSHLEAARAGEALETTRARRHVALNPCFGHGRGGVMDAEAARLALQEVGAKLMARRGWDREMRDAQDEIHDTADEGLTWRLGQVAERLQKPEGDGEEAVAEVVTAPNGLELDRNALEQSRALLDAIKFEKKSRPGRG
ncbi:MAG: DNA primase [Sulfitobacter sp.]|jgi:DNA primase